MRFCASAAHSRARIAGAHATRGRAFMSVGPPVMASCFNAVRIALTVRDLRSCFFSLARELCE